MATYSVHLRLLFLLLTLSGVQVLGAGFGINYGQIADNLPSPSSVSVMLQPLDVSRLKLYDANPKVLQAFSNSSVEFIVGIGNGYLQDMADPVKAQNWVQQNLQPYLAQTKITCISVGNEVFMTNDTQMWSYLLPAMKTVYNTLVNLGLDKQVIVTTAHPFTIIGDSYPPSSGTFRQDVIEYMQPILDFHSQTKSPFLINAYPFFAYKDNPDQIPLDYAFSTFSLVISVLAYLIHA
ncbi:glucan endo-1,3-beta-glucosidase 14-like [Populus alba x Populus x berolinensis]|uniref:glucan endo-1,3-beta-D-glucosidase n=1 Tax=Populus alba x Populus x berolinensis TaxID=444605 RepID=A0AAD6MJ41_9ROSI|nr:glucan endo-1,3-beta-glucosidase 14-like [Populus alba x Populus x berolinensis]